MPKRFLILIISFLIFSSLNAQLWKKHRYEFVGGVGTTNLLGDIGGSNSQNALVNLVAVDILSTRPNIYLGFRYKLTEKYALKLHFANSYFQGSDKGSRFEYRNYSFFTTAFEYGIQFEYSLTKENMIGNRFGIMVLREPDKKDFDFSINTYLFAGAGALSFFPEMDLDGIPNPFEGDFKKITLVIPVGIGFKYTFHKKLCAGIELGARYTFSDFIDGFRTENSKAKDLYWLATINIVYRFTTSRNGLPKL